ncbi:uncharacterized protein LOC128998267 [Macrosteles quadrilineatus]|uniref:uncharacterized protein LOC128998267 n=1 Tax=Macrosteles quadrilineatus TaxID=74068 RepID=UPI0023E2E896|nr:uncharacterized protein LOC128998267 [Macrosteles quadrilineatus]
MATKKEFSQLTGQVSELQKENIVLRKQIEDLQQRESVVMSRLVDLEGRSRRNNLIFRGLKWSKETRNFNEIVRKFCNDVFGSADTIFVNRAHPLGGSNNAIIAHLPNDADIYYIMSRVRELKGTGYSVHRDYPKEVREKRACLSKLRDEIESVAGKQKNKISLYFDHMTFKGHRFTWEGGELKAGNQDGAQLLQTLFKRDFSDFLRDLKVPRSTVVMDISTERTTASTTQGSASATGTSKNVSVSTPTQSPRVSNHDNE